MAERDYLIAKGLRLDDISKARPFSLANARKLGENAGEQTRHARLMNENVAHLVRPGMGRPIVGKKRKKAYEAAFSRGVGNRGPVKPGDNVWEKW